MVAAYSPIDGGSIVVANSAYNFFSGQGGITGKAVTSNITGPGTLVVEFFGEPDPNEPGNYTVVSTDYDSYAVFYTC